MLIYRGLCIGMRSDSPRLHRHEDRYTSSASSWSQTHLISIVMRPNSPQQFRHEARLTSSVSPWGQTHLISIVMRPDSPHQYRHEARLTSSVSSWGQTHLISIAMRPDSPRQYRPHLHTTLHWSNTCWTSWCSSGEKMHYIYQKVFVFNFGQIIDFSVNDLCAENRPLSQRIPTPHKIKVDW